MLGFLCYCTVRYGVVLGFGGWIAGIFELFVWGWGLGKTAVYKLINYVLWSWAILHYLGKTAVINGRFCFQKEVRLLPKV